MELTLDEIGKKHKTDKSSLSWLNYLDHYEKYFKDFKHEHINFLEIGIARGASALTWQEYFSNANITVVDIDGDPDRIKDVINLDRVDIVIGDIMKEKTISALDKHYAVIIDDASHKWSHQINTFESLFPKLDPSGLYIIEDLHTSYIDDFKDTEINTVDYLHKMVANMCKKGHHTDIKSIEFIRYCCIIRKK
jgi:hypothetical protein